MAFDEPTEHWSPADSLDPTPVWKQYIVVVLIGVAVIVFGIVYAYVAFLPDVVTPPAALPGRVVLSRLQYAPGTTQRVDLGRPDESFYLTYAAGQPVAVRALWSPELGAKPRCDVRLAAETAALPSSSTRVFVDTCTNSFFDDEGRPVEGNAPRGLDRYLVSRKGDRLIVNTDHLIQGTP